eukprot:m.6510 g.6510  ORF g.6510 m.6510 type:complete len:556 (+) comp3544_c0_seq2:535-2202(+)
MRMKIFRFSQSKGAMIKTESVSLLVPLSMGLILVTVLSLFSLCRGKKKKKEVVTTRPSNQVENDADRPVYSSVADSLSQQNQYQLPPSTQQENPQNMAVNPAISTNNPNPNRRIQSNVQAASIMANMDTSVSFKRKSDMEVLSSQPTTDLFVPEKTAGPNDTRKSEVMRRERLEYEPIDYWLKEREEKKKEMEKLETPFAIGHDYAAATGDNASSKYPIGFDYAVPRKSEELKQDNKIGIGFDYAMSQKSELKEDNKPKIGFDYAEHEREKPEAVKMPFAEVQNPSVGFDYALHQQKLDKQHRPSQISIGFDYAVRVPISQDKLHVKDKGSYDIVQGPDPSPSRYDVIDEEQQHQVQQHQGDTSYEETSVFQDDGKQDYIDNLDRDSPPNPLSTRTRRQLVNLNAGKKRKLPPPMSSDATSALEDPYLEPGSASKPMVHQYEVIDYEKMEKYRNNSESPPPPEKITFFTPPLPPRTSSARPSKDDESDNTSDEDDLPELTCSSSNVSLRQNQKDIDRVDSCGYEIPTITDGPLPRPQQRKGGIKRHTKRHYDSEV